MELKAASVDCEDGNFSRSLNDLWPLDEMNPKKGRFPCCIVWAPLPIISWLAPYIGHVGICLEDGAVLDFAGSNFVNIDNFAYGAVAKYVQLDRKQRICLATHACSPTSTLRVEQQSLGIMHLTFARSNTNTNAITSSHATATPLFPSASTSLHTMAMSGGIC